MRVVGLILAGGLALIGCGTGGTSIRPSLLQERAGSYANPMRMTVPNGSLMESCPDPSIIRGQASGDSNWYLYCTEEMFTDHSRVHYISIAKSTDLVNWTYVGDVFAGKPRWVASDAHLWAPEIQYYNGKYYLYYAASNTRAGGAAIFVVTSSTPTGPWTASPTPVVEPESVPGRGMRPTIDPAVVQDGDQKYIFYGSFNGGISARALSADGMTSDRGSQVQITLSDRYEAPYIIKRNGYFYLFVSAGACCDGALSGYGVYAARSPNVLGPYVDKDGNSLLESRIGGTPVLTMNGNRWIGPGHNAVITDASGVDWMIYHAIDAAKPYFDGSWTRRPAMLDPITWIEEWPRVRAGAGPSDTFQNAPIMAFGTPTDTTTAIPVPYDQPGTINTQLSDEFDESQISPQWSWIRASAGAHVGGGMLEYPSQSGDIYQGDRSASLLTEPAPQGDFMVEVRLISSAPVAGVFNFVQGGIIIYKNDYNYIKLDSVAINNTRQIEFAKQYVPGATPKYGNTLLASPADVTYLRLVKRTASSGQELYTGYSSHDGVNWERGGTWTHNLGPNAKIGLISMGRSGYINYFDYIHVFALAN